MYSFHHCQLRSNRYLRMLRWMTDKPTLQREYMNKNLKRTKFCNSAFILWLKSHGWAHSINWQLMHEYRKKHELVHWMKSHNAFKLKSYKISGSTKNIPLVLQFLVMFTHQVTTDVSLEEGDNLRKTLITKILKMTKNTSTEEDFGNTKTVLILVQLQSFQDLLADNLAFNESLGNGIWSQDGVSVRNNRIVKDIIQKMRKINSEIY